MSDVAQRFGKADKCDCDCGSQGGKTDDVRMILARRYASGEINKQEFDQIKADLGLGGQPAKEKAACC